MKTIVIYKSKTGHTKQYAQWIAEELSADILPADKVSFQKLAEYDCIIFGGRLYAVGIDGLSLIKKNFEKLRGKRLIVFAVGASPVSETTQSTIRDANLSAQQQSAIKLFYFRGGFDYAALPFFDKTLMTLMKKMILSKQRKGKELSSDEAGMLELYDKATDFTKKEDLHDLIQAALIPF